MKNRGNSKNTTLLKRSAVMLVLLAVCLVSAVVCFHRAFAWFSENRKVTANGATVNLDGYGITDVYFSKGVGAADYTQITGWDHLFQDLNPGESLSIRAQYANQSDETHVLRVYFGLNDGNSVTPLVKDGKYYYFGTQLKITEVVLNGVAQSVADQTFLMTPPADKIAYDAEQTVQNVFLVEIPLLPGDSATAEITVQFVNYPDVDQNAYQGFGKGTESCFRQLIAFVDD